MSDSDLLTFADESDDNSYSPTGRKWKLLVVDDDEFVHKVTSMVLKDYRFEGCKLDIISAFSGKEGRERMLEHPDTAVILLDVVMETPQAGLELADWIRNVLKNTAVRIILRTGQSGTTSENDTILKYDINDYKTKTELTSQNLAASLSSAIQAYEIIRSKEAL